MVTTQVGTVDDVADASAAVELTGRRYEAATARIRLEKWGALFVGLDALSVGAAVLVSFVTRLALGGAARMADYRLIALSIVPGWLVVMALAGAYNRRHIATGFEQYRRVVNGAVWILAGAGFASFALHADISRAFILSSIAFAALLTIITRQGARRVLQRRLSREGVAAYRVLAIGLPPEVRDLVQHMQRASYAGFKVVGALTPGGGQEPHLPAGVRWAGSDLDQAVRSALESGADTIAIAAPHLLPPGGLRRLSWELEGTEIDLILAPAITDIAGPRIHIRPVDGLPLMFVDKPQFKGARRLLKEVVDRTTATCLFVLLSPLMLAAVIAVRCTPGGPVLFRHTRVGHEGRTFSVLKFRTMREGSSAMLAPNDRLYEDDRLPFKSRRDPRVTSVGRFLRRYSIDELPQLWNVIRGQMSLVGPRPLVPEELEGRDASMARRLLVKPGITGLWQVSGRSEASWEERIRLDLHYVDNWSVGLDFVLLWKTLASVVRGRGAY